MHYIHKMRGIIIHGGRDNKHNRIFNDVHFYNIPNQEWINVIIPGKHAQSRYGHCSYIKETALVIFGGVNYQSFVST